MTGAHRPPRNRHTLTLIVGVLAVLLAAGLTIAIRGGHSTPSAAGTPGTPTAITSPTPSAPSVTTRVTAVSRASVKISVITPAKGVATKPAPTRLTYTVKPGDTLFTIAAWFHQHGFGALYEQNKAVLGDDPDLIHPGQRITVSAAGMVAG